MKTESEIIALSEIKLKAAELLLKNGFFEDAYYLGGYAFELILKARICKILCIPNFFETDKSKLKPFGKNTDKIDRSYKVHDYKELIILSGLYKEFSNKLTDPIFMADWSVIEMWTEEHRYLSGKKQIEVESFINSQKNMTSWVLSHL